MNTKKKKENKTHKICLACLGGGAIESLNVHEGDTLKVVEKHLCFNNSLREE